MILSSGKEQLKARQIKHFLGKTERNHKLEFLLPHVLSLSLTNTKLLFGLTLKALNLRTLDLDCKLHFLHAGKTTNSTVFVTTAGSTLYYYHCLYSCQTRCQHFWMSWYQCPFGIHKLYTLLHLTDEPRNLACTDRLTTLKQNDLHRYFLY